MYCLIKEEKVFIEYMEVFRKSWQYYQKQI